MGGGIQNFRFHMIRTSELLFGYPHVPRQDTKDPRFVRFSRKLESFAKNERPTSKI